MSEHDLLVLSRDAYYAPCPVLTVDRTGAIVDFNIAAELLMSPHLQGGRLRHVRAFLKRWGQDASGDLFPPGVMPVSRGENGASLEDPRLTSSQDFVSRLRTKQFGRVELSGTAITHLGPSTGHIKGMTVFWNPLRVQRRSLYRERLAKKRIHQLTWDSYAFSYDRLMPCLPFYREVISRHVDAMQCEDIATVLDLGAGTGNVTIPLAETSHHVTAVDVSRAMLERLRTKSNDSMDERLTVIEQSAEALPQWSDASFDGVTILLALYDMSHPLRCMAEAIRLLRPGGHIVITEPKRDFRLQQLIDFTEEFLREQRLYEAYRDDWERVRRANVTLDPSERAVRLTAEDIAEKLRRKGFEDIEMKESHLGNCATIWARRRLEG